MTYAEALNFKESLKSDSIVEGGIKMHILITPQAYDDFDRYIDDYRVTRFTNETAKLYSHNNQFTVCGLWTDGANVIHRNLENDPVFGK